MAEIYKLLIVIIVSPALNAVYLPKSSMQRSSRHGRAVDEDAEVSYLLYWLHRVAANAKWLVWQLM